MVYLGYLLLLALAASHIAQEGMRKVGDRVFVSFDNIGAPAVITEVREEERQPPSHYKVRLDDGQEFWAFDYEVGDEKEDGPHA